MKRVRGVVDPRFQHSIISNLLISLVNPYTTQQSVETSFQFEKKITIKMQFCARIQKIHLIAENYTIYDFSSYS